MLDLPENHLNQHVSNYDGRRLSACSSDSTECFRMRTILRVFLRVPPRRILLQHECNLGSVTDHVEREETTSNAPSARSVRQPPLLALTALGRGFSSYGRTEKFNAASNGAVASFVNVNESLVVPSRRTFARERKHRSGRRTSFSIP